MTDSNAKTEVPAALGEEIGGAGRAYFENVVIDNILDALLELSAAVWTYHDRVNVLEKVLEKNGISVADEIEAHLPDEAELAARAEERDALVQRVFASFLRRPVAGAPDPAQHISEGDRQ
jgi:hypothetical protein